MLGLSSILFVITSVIASIYLWLKHQSEYWQRQNIPFIKTSSTIFGNLKDTFILKLCAGEMFQKLYNDKDAQNQPVVGIRLFNRSALLIREPELIKRVLVKDFYKFSNRYSRTEPNVDILNVFNLFFSKNRLWKEMRARITPVFTTGKLKQTFQLIKDIGNELDSYISSASKLGSVSLELKELCAQYTTDVIASTAFGLQANCINNPKSEFRRNGKALFFFNTLRGLEFNAIFLAPHIANFFRCRLFIKEATEFLRRTITYAIAEREKDGTKRNDFIDTLVEMKKQETISFDNTEIKMEGDALVGSAATFFIAGFDTTATTMSFGLYELSKNVDMQERLRNEIRDTLKASNGVLTYESMNSMVYLEMVIKETLRMYPTLPYLDRVNNESDYSLEPYSDFKIPKGMPIFIASYAMHRDPKYFSDPDRFNPERFSPENKDSVDPYTYMPFGVGPHSCIGERLGMIQVKVGIISFLKNHFVRLGKTTKKDIKLDGKALLLQAEGGLNCDVEWDPLI